MVEPFGVHSFRILKKIRNECHNYIAAFKTWFKLKSNLSMVNILHCKLKQVYVYHFYNIYQKGYM